MTFYNYNDEGLLSDIIGTDGSKISLAYTPRKQPETVIYPDGTRLRYTYNSCNRRSSVVSNTGYNSTYLYDDFCRLSEIVDETGSRVASFEYGEDSRMIRKRLGNGMYIEYEYVDYSLNLKHVKTFFPNNSLFSSFTYKYDDLGNVMQSQTDEEQDKSDITQHQFVYNADGQVTRTVIGRTVCEYNYTVFGSVSSDRCSDGSTQSYTSDPFGKRGAVIIERKKNKQREFWYHGERQGLIGTVHSDDRSNSMYQVINDRGETVKVGIQSKPGQLKENIRKVEDTNGAQPGKPRSKSENQSKNSDAESGNTQNSIDDDEEGDTCETKIINPIPIYDIRNSEILTYVGIASVFIPHINVIVGVNVLVGMGVGAFNYLTSLEDASHFTVKGFFTATAAGGVNGYISSFRVVGKFISKFVGGMTELFITKNFKDITIMDVLKVIAQSLVHSLIQSLPMSDANKLLLGAEADIVISTYFQWIQSQDPNEISAPLGYGDGHYISADHVLEYKIEFENDPNATAPAQLVSITCPLDPGLDMATFKVGAFAFDTHISDAGFNSFYNKGLINATETTGTIVFVQATLDVVRSEARWLFQALDPNTGLPPTSPLVGFLPPNNVTTGQGYVTFQIRVKQSLTTNTHIRENAFYHLR